MSVLSVKGIYKEYPGFKLQDVSFEIEKGTIMGFVGRNGAGKSTTLKSILNLVHMDAGHVEFFGLDLKSHESDIKQLIGYTGGAVNFYKKKKIKKLIEITKSFYRNWDDELCKKYMRIFSLDENKTPSELSEGMKVKLSLVLALSHGAELLILDEPTSGLDPVSRNELLEIFKHLKTKGISVLFSTHIISDLEKCADEITYISNGKIVYTGCINGFVSERESLEDAMMQYEKEGLYEKLADERV